MTGTEVNNVNVAIIDYEIDNYDTSIKQLQSILTSSVYNGDFRTHYGPSSLTNVEAAKTKIDDSIKQLTFSDTITEYGINDADNSYSEFYSDLQESNRVNNDLNNLVAEYRTTEVKLANSKKTNTYYNLMIWVLALIFVAVSLFFSIIEDKKDINIFTKILLFIGLLVIFVYIAKNVWFYIERNIQ